jgi:hypothetical protein
MDIKRRNKNMDKDIILKKELKGFNINIDDIEPNDNILGALEEAIVRMRNEYLINRLEVVLNDNLIEVKDKITNCRTLFGARISYDNLPKDISFVIREDNKPTYEQLEQQCKKQKEVIDKAVEYINQHWVIDDPVLFKNDLLEILENKEVSE